MSCGITTWRNWKMDKNKTDALAKALKQMEAIKHEPSKRDSEPFRPEYRQPAIEKLGYYNRSDYLPYRI